MAVVLEKTLDLILMIYLGRSKMKTEMYAYLAIEKFSEDPDVITRIVGVKPTRIQRKGDPVGKSKLKCRFNSWEYRVSAPSKFDLESLVKKILSKFKDEKKLKKAIAKGVAEIVCVFYTADREPIITLSPKTLSDLSDLKCGFSLDYYLSGPQ